MQILPITLLLLLVSGSAFSQQSLDEQIAAVNRVQNERKIAERAAVERAKAEAAARVAAEERRRLEREAYERKRVADREAYVRKKAAESATLAAKEKQRQHELQKTLIEEAKADKIRNQAFEDEMRQLELEERKIILSERKARATRVDDFIDQELRAQAAATDVTQSRADVNRNLSEGAKKFLESTGRAKEKDASRLFR